MTMRIPNEEVISIYENHVRGWFSEKIAGSDLHRLYEALLTGEARVAEEELNELLMGTISYMDSKEAFYHEFLAGVLAGITSKNYRVKSNRESGSGRSDLMLIPPNSRKPAVVIEIKAAVRLKEMEELADQALEQIREKGYETELEELGCSEVLRYGIAFYRKECRVKSN